MALRPRYLLAPAKRKETGCPYVADAEQHFTRHLFGQKVGVQSAGLGSRVVFLNEEAEQSGRSWTFPIHFTWTVPLFFFYLFPYF